MAASGIKVHVYGDYDDKDINKAIKDLQSLKTQAAPTTGGLDSITGAFKRMALAAGAFVSIGVVTDFLGSAIQQGSALEESLSKVGVVFGQSAAEIKDWSAESAQAFGLSQQAALESVGTFGNLFQAFGVGQESAKDMSKQLVQTAADLASFNNTSVDEALIAIRSALSGEAEPMKKFGASITDARLKTEAFALGLYSGKGALDANAKSQAAYALIMKDTALAQGDFQRTADGFANTMRTMQAEFDNAKAAIGGALIDAIENATNAFGGSDGIASAMADASDRAVILIERFGGIVGILGDVKAASENLPAWMTGGGDTSFLQDIGNNINPAVGAFQSLVTALGLAGDAGAVWNGTQVQMADVAPSAINHYVRMAPALNAVSDSLDATADSADAAAQALVDAQDAAKQLIATISNSQTIDDFRKSLADLDEGLKGNARTFKGMGDAAKENRDTLRSSLSEAASIAQQWVDEGRISADQYQAAYKGLSKKVVNQFVKDGFKRSDIEAFLGGEGIWTGPLKSNLTAAQKAAVTAGYSAGKGAGTATAQGYADGITAATWKAEAQARAMAKVAIMAAKDELDSHSPSRVFAAIGGDVVDGLILGLDSKKDKVKQAASDMISAMSEKAGSMLSNWDDHLAGLKDKLDNAVGLFNDFRDQIASGIFGQLDLGAAVDKAKESGGSVADAFIAQGKKVGDFAQQMIELTKTNLSQSAWSAVAALGAERGAGLAETMLGAQGQATIDSINKVYTDVDTMATAVGALAAQKWYGEGVTQAQKAYEGFRDNFGPGGPARVALENLMDRLSSALDRTSTITVRTVYEAAGIPPGNRRAKGGPVAFGEAYLVGEKGPEVFVPDASGTIVPNGGLPSATGYGAGGGNSYSINVQAGVGDPRQIGQQVVEYIRRFEQANGNVFAAA